MPSEFEKTFDDAAWDYEKVRPRYPAEIFSDILRYQPLDEKSEVLEIGMGTGAATEPFLRTGCRLVGIEPGEHLAKRALEKYRKYPGFSMRTERFEDYPGPDGQYDLVFAATAFHWIPEAYGYGRVYELLKSGGTFARFRYHAGPDESRKELAEEIQEVYRTYMQKEKPAAFGEADAKAIAELALNYGFTDVAYRLYRTTKEFTADEYLSLLRTYPDHMKLPERNRTGLFDGIRSAIERHGGNFTVYYTMDLELARKP